MNSHLADAQFGVSLDVEKPIMSSENQKKR
jgi:hypothetical protein